VPRQAPARLSRNLLAEHRPGAAVAVAMGLSAGIPLHQLRGYEVHARSRALALVGVASNGGAPPAPSSQVGVVTIRGVMEQRAGFWSCGETPGYDTIEEDICEALADPGVGSLVIACDTPGGDVAGLEETTARIRAVVDAIGKPVLGWADELIASAGVYLMLGICSGLYLPPSGRIGSISSVVIFQSESRALEMDGIDTYVARGLPGKMNPNSFEPLDALGKARLDAFALECSDRFIAFVASTRGIDPAVIRGWDGGMFTGAAAVAAGLADGIGSLDDTITLAAELAALKEIA
jgi:ClpP class serine protease